jgi:hypothetical protein
VPHENRPKENNHPKGGTMKNLFATLSALCVTLTFTQTAHASIFGDVGNFVLTSLFKAAGGIWVVLSIVVVWMTKKHLVPLLAIERHRRYAEWIARIADEVTDDLVQKYPNERWAKFLDNAVDKVMEITGISKETARRAVTSAIARK